MAIKPLVVPDGPRIFGFRGNRVTSNYAAMLEDFVDESRPTVEDYLADKHGYRPIRVVPANWPLESDILFACYTIEGYEGYAFALFVDYWGDIWEVNASHCSCMGLEGQWHPEKTSWPALNLRTFSSIEEGDPTAYNYLRTLITANLDTDVLEFHK